MKKKGVHVPSKLSQGYLRAAMFVTLLAALALLITYLDARAIDRVGAVFRIAPMLEYITAAVFVALGGTFLLEAVLNDPRFSKR